MPTDDNPSGRAAYQLVLRLPTARFLLAVAILGRVPANAAPLVLTLHVVGTLGNGYAAAGAVAAAATVGSGLGAPLLGRLTDRRGLRTVLVVATLGETAFWCAAPVLPFPALLPAALAGGILGMPINSLVRQCLTVAVPPPHRRAAFALDAMSTDLSFIAGPAFGVLLVTQLTSTVAIWLIGLGWVAVGSALWAANPPTGVRPRPGGTGPDHRPWCDARLLAILLAAATIVLLSTGTELSLIAALESTDGRTYLAPVYAVWAIASMAGGYLYGAAARPPRLFPLLLLLVTFTVPLSFAGTWWSYLLLLIPAGLAGAAPMAATVEEIGTLAPDDARGVITGLHGFACTAGAAIATPVTGILLDTYSPTVTFAAVAAVALCVTLTAWWLTTTSHR
ncbi:MFS transporter [Nocardia wallacei]|nr:MFS transporter [Nocardia wallacei]